MAFYVSVQTFRRRLLLLLSLFAMHYFLEALMEEMITFKGSIVQAPSTPPGIQPSCPLLSTAPSENKGWAS